MRVQSAEALLTRVFGRPTERVETTQVPELTRLTNLTEAQLLKLRQELEASNVIPLPRTGRSSVSGLGVCARVVHGASVYAGYGACSGR